MFRRLITAGLAVALSALLVACGQTNNESNAEKPASGSASNKSTEVIKVGMSGSYYPFTYVENGELQGYEVDVLNAVGKHLNRPVEFVTAPFSGLFGMLESNRIDTIANQITITDQRKEKYNFSTPYVYDGAQITVNKNNNAIHSLKDLQGKTVAVNLGSNFEAIVRENDPEGLITVRTYDTGIEQEVALGRVDAFVMDRLSAAELVNKSGLPLKAAGEPIEVIANAMPFLKNDKEDALRLQINKALAAMKKDGTLAAISKKWFGTDISRKG